MLKLVNGFRDMGLSNRNFVDCYVSCESYEAETLLERLGYDELLDIEDDFSFIDLYRHLSGIGCRLKNKTNGIIMDCVEIPIDEDLRQRKYLGESGFPAQTKLRIYNNTNQPVRILTQVAKKFLDNHYHVAFVNLDNNTAYVAHARSDIKKYDTKFGVLSG